MIKNNEYTMMTEQEAQDFMSSPLPERFHRFWLEEFGDEDSYVKMIQNNHYNYLPILQQVKEKLPVEFYAYFHDLLCDEEQDKYYQIFNDAILGKITGNDECE